MEIGLKSSLTIFLCLLFATTITIAAHESKIERETYIVYMGEVPEQMSVSHAEHHHNILMSAIGDEAIARESRLHSYGRSIYGFVAKLLPQEVARLREHEEVVSVFRSEKKKLVTTRSWNFLGFTEKRANRNVKLESNTIVGLLDSGIDIRAPSFNDEGYGPVPPKWKGKCENGPDFPGCNKKVIGATWYNVGQIDPYMTPTPYDYIGHGSHTASTAAGGTVHGASLYGLGLGTARGGVPLARIAMYRVCGLEGCSDANILAGYDDAIADGVDILSVSLGSFPTSFYSDTNAIGAFHAMKKGIPVVLAGGNDGPLMGLVSNVAPWMFTVAATNMDREFVTKVRLGNGVQVSGISLNAFMPPKKMLPLIAGSSAQNSSQPSNASMCDPDGMIKEKVKGCIVLCYTSEETDSSLHRMGVAGALMVSERFLDTGFANSIPDSHIDYNTANSVANYIKSTKNPTATIFKSISAKIKAPTIASYSSRGPQAVVTNILKPDISAPGTDILAAYSKAPSVSGLEDDNRHCYFNIISGTSMATPHTAGAVAYVKTFHPDWSPAALKSAVMTTATPVQVSGPEQPLDSGSGQIDPLRAVHPGLVYDIKPSDYIRYLCREGYNSSTLRPIVGGKKPLFNCSNYPAPRGHDGINYPSMHIQLPIDQQSATVMFHRVVTYVGDGPSVFEARVNVLAASANELSVKVTPQTLSFNHTHQKKSFRVEVKVAYAEDVHGTLVAFLEWADSSHSVRSPIVVFRPSIDD